MGLVSLITNYLFLIAPLYYDRREESGSNKSPNERPYTILIEGNVGSGKSTTLQYFSMSHGEDLEIVYEPVHLWQNVSGMDLLQLMFDKPKRWAGTFQLYSSLTRFQNIFKANTKPIRMMERSIYSGRYCFLEVMKEYSGMTDPEYLVNAKWFDLLTREFADKVKPDLIVYLKTDPKILMERIKRRQRKEEANVSMDFLLTLQKKHEDWLIHRNSSFPIPAPVLVLDGNLPLKPFIQELKNNEKRILPHL